MSDVGATRPPDAEPVAAGESKAAPGDDFSGFALTESPYPGLRPFRRDETTIFFGRDRHIDSMLRLLSANRFLAVTGTSGAGKSSLVKTGLYSALELGYMRSGGDNWEIVEARPQTHPLVELGDELVNVLGGGVNDAAIRSLMQAALSRSPESATEILGNIITEKGASLLIVIDQFEELFRYEQGRSDDEEYAFVSMLLELARQRTYPIYVVLTLRSDFLGECSRFEGLAEEVNRSLFLTPQMNRDELREAIESPAIVFGGKVDPRLVNRILNDLEKASDQLPLMQHALARLWDKAKSASDAAPYLTLEMYDEIGGVNGALNQHADMVLKELGDRAYLAERLFRQLCGRSEGADDVRRPTQLADLLTLTHSSLSELVPVIEAFRRSDRSFLAPPYGALTPDTTIDISHESLIRQWDLLRKWATDEQLDAAQYRRLDESARLYAEGAAQLLRSNELDNARAWRDRVNPTALWASRHVPHGDFGRAMAFLAESQRVAATEERDADRARRRRTSQLLWQRGALAGALLFFVVLAVFAFLQYGNAQGNLEVARQEKMQAALGQTELIVQRVINEFQSGHPTKGLAFAAEAQRLAARNPDMSVIARSMQKLQPSMASISGSPLDTQGSVSAIADTSGFAGDDLWVGLSKNGNLTSLGVWNDQTGSSLKTAPLPANLWLGTMAPGLSVAGVVTNGGKAGILPLTTDAPMEWLDEADNSSVFAMSLGGTAGAERALIATGKDKLELRDVHAAPATLLDTISAPALADSDYLDYAYYDGATARFAVLTEEGYILVGSTDSDKLSVAGFLKVHLGDKYSSSTSRSLRFDLAGNAVVGHVDSCVFRLSLADLTDSFPPDNPEQGKDADPAQPGVSVGCPSKDLNISGVIASDFSADAQAVTLASANSSYVIDLRADELGTIIGQVDGAGGSAPIDIDLHSGTVVMPNSAFGDAAIFDRSVEASVAHLCTDCQFVGDVGAGFLFSDGGTDANADRTIFYASRGPDGKASVRKLPADAGYQTLVGISGGADAVILANDGLTAGELVALDGSGKPQVMTIEDRSKSATNAPGQGDGPSRIGYAEDSGVLRFTIRPDGQLPAWPDFYVPATDKDTAAVATVVAYASAKGWLAVATHGVLDVNDTSAAGKSLLTSDNLGVVSRLAFTPDGNTLVVATDKGIWTVHPGKAGGDVHLVSDVLIGTVTALEAGTDSIVFVDDGRRENQNGSSSDPEPRLFRIPFVDGQDASAKAQLLADWSTVTWAASWPGEMVTLGDGIVEWHWPDPKTSIANVDVALAAARPSTIASADLQDILFTADALKDSFAAHFGSAACADDAFSNRRDNVGIGCRTAVSAAPQDANVLLAHGLELLNAGDDPAPAFSGGPVQANGAVTEDAEEGELLVFAAATGGDPAALAVLADLLSPTGQQMHPKARLLPATGWRETIGLLDRIYANGGPLPSSVIDLATGADDGEKGFEDGRKLWRDRINQPQYATEPIAVLARTIIAERSGMDPQKALKSYADLLPQLNRVMDDRAAGIAKNRVAGLARSDGEDLAATLLKAAYASPKPQTPAPAELHLDPAILSYLKALATPDVAVSLRPAAIGAALKSMVSILEVNSDATTPPLVEMKVLAEQLDEGVDPESLAGFAHTITSRATNIEDSDDTRQLVSKLFKQLNYRVASVSWAADLEHALLARYETVFEAATATADQQLMVAVWHVLDAPAAKVPDALKGDLAIVRSTVLDNFGAALGRFANQADVGVEFEKRRFRLAQIAAAIGDNASALALAGDVLAGASADKTKLAAVDSGEPSRAAILAQVPPFILARLPAQAPDTGWLSGNWQSLLVPFTDEEIAFRNSDLNGADRITRSPAAIALLQSGLDLDDKLATLYGGGPNWLARSNAYLGIGLLYDDFAGRQRDAGDQKGSNDNYLVAAKEAEESARLGLIGDLAKPGDADNLDLIRFAFSDAGTAYNALGMQNLALPAILKARTYGEKAYAAGGSAYLERYVQTIADESYYRQLSDPADLYADALSLYRTIAAVPEKDRASIHQGYIGQVLRNIGEALGAAKRALEPAEPPDACDELVAHPDDPLHRGDGKLLYQIADANKAYQVCRAAFDAGASLSDLDRGRLAFSVGRAIYAAEGNGAPIANEKWDDWFTKSAGLGYPMGYLGHTYNLVSADDGFTPATVSFFNTTMRLIGPHLAELYDARGTSNDKDVADWLRSLAAQTGDVKDQELRTPAATAK